MKDLAELARKEREREQNQRKRKRVIIPLVILIVIALIAVAAIVAFAVLQRRDYEPPTPEPGVQTVTLSDEVTDLEAPLTYHLMPGYYRIGTDIPEGVYDFKATNGDHGYVSTDIGSYEGGINELMGFGGVDYLKEFRNAWLVKGEVLQIEGVELDLTTKKCAPSVEARIPDISDQTFIDGVTPVEGVYTIGNEIPAGTYDLFLLEGSGWIYCETEDYSFSFYQFFSTDPEDDGFSAFYHLTIPEGTTMEVSDYGDFQILIRASGATDFQVRE